MINTDIVPNKTLQNICQSTLKLYQGAVILNKVVKETVNSPCRVATMLATGICGVKSLFDGDIFTGGLCATLAYKEGVNIFSAQDNRSEISFLLKEAKAGIEMIEVLGEENKKSFQVIDFNLNLVEENVANLTNQLQEIESLAITNCQAFDEQKTVVAALYKEADDLFAQAKEKLESSQILMTESHQGFLSVVHGMEKLVVSAQEITCEEELNAFIKATKIIHKQAKQSSKKLDKANPRFNEGLQLLKQAMAKKDQASFEAGKAIQMAKDQSEKMAKMAVVEKDYQAEIRLVNEELNKVKIRNAIQEDLLRDAAQAIEEAERKNDEAWGWQSTIIGGGIGALAGNAVYGPLGAFPGIAAGGKIYHEKEKIGEFIFGKEPPPVPADPSTDTPVTFEFNAKSTGLWGRYFKKRQSYTCGRVAIKLGGNETVEFSFDLNREKPIRQKEISDLSKRLIEQLREGRISKDYCKKVLTQLENIQIDRGGHHKTAQGFIKAGSSSSRFLRNVINTIEAES